MLVIKKLKKQPNGEFEATWSLTEQEAGYLLSYAINSLVGEGVVSVIEKEESDEGFFKEKQNENQMQLDFLANVPNEILGKA